MGLLVGEKRKNDEQRRGLLPLWAWTLIIGFILGVMVTLMLRPSGFQSVTYFNGDSSSSSNLNDEAIYATATYIVEQATATQAAIDAAKP